LNELKERNVLVTGAGRGIGKRLAIGFARCGARLGLLARSKAELDLAHLEIEHQGGVSIRIRADVTDFDQVSVAVERYRTQYGPPQVAVCAAAMQGPIGPFLSNAAKSWIETVSTNLLGVVNVCRAVLPHMVERRSGKIIVLAGRGATEPRQNFSAYASSKAAVVRFVETLAAELLDHNIQVNCMSPGATYTSMSDEVLRAGDLAGWKEQEEADEIRHTGGASPDKQMQLAQFLASDESNHITGRLIHINDDWKKLKTSNINPEAYTLRRITKT